MSSVSHGWEDNTNLNHLMCNYKLITDYPRRAFASYRLSLPFHNPLSILPYSYSNSSNCAPALTSTEARSDSLPFGLHVGERGELDR